MRAITPLAWRLRALAGVAAVGLIGGIISCGSEPSGGGGGQPGAPGGGQPAPQPSALESLPPGGGGGVPPATPYPSPGPSLNPQPGDDGQPGEGI